MKGTKIEWNVIETKWRKRWQQDHVFETDPNEKSKKFITVAYPYPNSPQHIGHGRTYTLADVHARFYRMKGFNVLLPMGFHYTGTPILGMSKRIEMKDKELLDGLQNIYHVPQDTIKTFVEPIKIADYFRQEIKSGMIEMGYSIDWRREFTTIDPAYKKFITWQINTLREKDLIIQGSHPVGWCPHDQNPVSQHDTLGDVEPDFTEYILIKFKLESDGNSNEEYIIPTATLRPETIFGVTNLWVNPNITYKKIMVDNKERWIVSKECAYKLEFLNKKVTYEGEIQGSDLIGKKVKLPQNDKMIPMLEASFVEAHVGTGLVMSVPAHAPFDYQALLDLKNKGHKLSTSIMPISIITTKGYSDIAAEQICKKFGIQNQKDPKLEEATNEIYNKEFYGGILKENCDQFKGIKVSDAKEQIKEWLDGCKYSDLLLELTETPVKCRCGTECVVKMLTNQWFLNYKDEDWKSKATKCLNSMSILPSEIKSEFHHVIEWLKERACARQHGLGTKIPWDEDWIVESLSDSVIYMSYYIIAKYVNDGTILAKDLSKEFFDYVFLGKGTKDAIQEISGNIIEEIRNEITYFYPVDSRHSGRDLVPNHLTFFVLNHVAIFPEEMWPRQIVVNGSVLMEGKKMSKSMGNIIPLRQAITNYGADPVRLAIIISAELLQDADFNLESVTGIEHKVESIFNECIRLQEFKADNSSKSESITIEKTEIPMEDRWILSKLQHLIINVTSNITKMRLREGLHNIIFAFDRELQWYNKRTLAKGRSNSISSNKILFQIYSDRVKMLSPFAPHIAEEMWEILGNTKKMASQSEWPNSDAKMIDVYAIQSETLVKSIIEDITNILKVTKIKPKKIIIYTPNKFKAKTYYSILEKIMSGKTSMGVIMKELMAESEYAENLKKNPDFVQKTIKDVLSEPIEIRNTRLEIKEFNEKELIAKELITITKHELGDKDIQVEVFDEDDTLIYDPKRKARHARPFKPAILIE